jgi:hypothetical protein
MSVFVGVPGPNSPREFRCSKGTLTEQLKAIRQFLDDTKIPANEMPLPILFSPAVEKYARSQRTKRREALLRGIKKASFMYGVRLVGRPIYGTRRGDPHLMRFIALELHLLGVLMSDMPSINIVKPPGFLDPSAKTVSVRDETFKLSDRLCTSVGILMSERADSADAKFIFVKRRGSHRLVPMTPDDIRIEFLGLAKSEIFDPDSFFDDSFFASAILPTTSSPQKKGGR